MANTTDTFVTLKKVSSLLEKCCKFWLQPMIGAEVFKIILFILENSQIEFNVAFIGFKKKKNCQYHIVISYCLVLHIYCYTL